MNKTFTCLLYAYSKKLSLFYKKIALAIFLLFFFGNALIAGTCWAVSSYIVVETSPGIYTFELNIIEIPDGNDAKHLRVDFIIGSTIELTGCYDQNDFQPTNSFPAKLTVSGITGEPASIGDILWDTWTSQNGCNGANCANQDTQLPAELTDFSVQASDSKAELKWETKSEINNAGFEIQRSMDARDWETLGFEAGHGTTVQTQNYSFLDRRPQPGYNYYRLKQIDFDGHYEYSEVKSVLIQNSANQKLEVFPNPNAGNFTLSLQNPDKKKAFIKLFDSTGNIIWEKQFGNDEAVLAWDKEFNLPQHEIYFVMTQVGDQVETQKIAVIGSY